MALSLALLLVVLAISSCGGGPAGIYLGTGVDQGLRLELAGDGTYSLAYFGGEYRVEGDTLTMSDPDGGEPLEARIEGDRIIFPAGTLDSHEIVLEKKG